MGICLSALIQGSLVLLMMLSKLCTSWLFSPDVGYMHEHIKWNIVDVVCCLYYEQFEDVPKMDILQKEPPYVPKQCQFKTSNNSTCLKKVSLVFIFYLFEPDPILLHRRYFSFSSTKMK